MFKVKLHEIKFNELPELDDEFAKDVSEFDTFDEYKKDVLAKIQQRYDTQADNEIEEQLVTALIEKLKAGQNIALVTDAGMPGISDPGEDLAKRCHQEGIPVTIAPGASAGISALVLSGMDARRYVFEGFLPVDKKERAGVLKNLEKETRTTVFYEAPHRLTDTLKALLDAAGDREAATVREITKKFEEVRRDSLSGLLKYYGENPPRGEFVVIVGGLSESVLRQEEIDSWAETSIEDHLQMYMDKGMSKKDAMKAVAKDRGVSKREIYAYLNSDE